MSLINSSTTVSQRLLSRVQLPMQIFPRMTIIMVLLCLILSLCKLNLTNFLISSRTERFFLLSKFLSNSCSIKSPPEPCSSRNIHMLNIRPTPISEFNRSQLLLFLAFPTLYSRSEADFVYPHFRPITHGHSSNCHRVAEKYSLGDCIEESFCRTWHYIDE
ncbi:hypothetical protein GGI42DRAFT_250086 [Trichoderma sp. SZMC 28013]